MSTIREATPRFDARLSKFSQAATFVLVGLAFVLHLPVIVLITTIILALSALVPAIGPYRMIYRSILVPLHILRTRMVEDDPAPHRFVQGVGTIFLRARYASWPLAASLAHSVTPSSSRFCAAYRLYEEKRSMWWRLMRLAHLNWPITIAS